MGAKMLIVAAGMGIGLIGNVELPSELREALPSMVIYRYEKAVESRKSVGSNDEEYKVISSFLQENKTRWEYDYRSYAPSIFFKGPNFSINCMPDGVVINYQNTKGEWKQISKSSKKPFCGLPPGVGKSGAGLD